MAQAVYTKLPERALITVSGQDRFDFLQGLITQNIDLLKTQDLIYSCLLTPNGKFLFDFFIFEDGEKLVIDCEGGDRATALLKRLTMFKLRSDVTLGLEDDVDVFQIFTPNNASSSGLSRGSSENQEDSPNKSGNDIGFYFKDPRFDGYRIYKMPSSSGLSRGSSNNQEDSPNKSGNDVFDGVDFNTWDNHRIKSEIPDGSRDMVPEKSFLHESQVIITTAVDFNKGCYMGQELVSRMHHRGLVKKQLRCVNIDSIPETAKLRSQCGEITLALVKD